MSAMEIFLLIVGALIFIISFFIPDNSEKNIDGEDSVGINMSDDVDSMVKEARDRLDSMVDESLDYSVEKAERSFDKITNDKMIAIDEFSQNVLGQIDQNHKEVVFLYDMLNNKSVELKNIVREAQELENKVKESKEQTESVNYEANEDSEFDFVPFALKNPENSIDISSENKRIIEPVAMDMEGAIELSISGENSNEKILELHSQGLTNVEIARELGLGMGEVKLVIDLYEGAK